MGLGFICKLKRNHLALPPVDFSGVCRKGSRCEGPLEDCSETHSHFIRKLGSLNIVLSDNDLTGVLKTELVV